MRSFSKIAWVLVCGLVPSFGCMAEQSDESSGAEEVSEAALAEGTTVPSPPCGPGTYIQSLGYSLPGFYAPSFYGGGYYPPAGAYGGLYGGYGGLYGGYGGYGGGLSGYGYGPYNQGFYGPPLSPCGCTTTPPP